MTLAMNVFGGAQGILLIILPLAGSVMLMYGMFQLVSDLRSANRKRVIERLKGDRKGTAKTAAAAAGDPTQLRRQAMEATGFLAQKISKLSITTKFQRVLDQANVTRSAPELLGKLTAASMITIAGLMAFGVSILPSLGAGAAVFVLPVLYLVRRRKKRLKRLTEQLPDVFELLSQALRAGHSLASGMQLVARELPDPAGTEFGRVFHEQNLGLKVEEALRNMADRVDVLDVRFFVTAVLIQRQTGGDLAEVLDKIGTVIRDRIKLFGTVQALTAEGRLSGYVLLALPVIVFFAMLQVNREYAELLIKTDAGRMMLTAAVTMQLMGWAMIKKIVNIKV